MSTTETSPNYLDSAAQNPPQTQKDEQPNSTPKANAPEDPTPRLKYEKKSHKGTLGRGRPPLSSPANPATAKVFQELMSESKSFPSLRQWAIEAEISYTTVLSWARGDSVPNAGLAIKFARAAKLSVEDIWGHLIPKPERKNPVKKTQAIGTSNEGS